MSQIKIKAIRAEDTWPHRQKVMYPELTVDEMRLEKDFEGTHYGLFVDDQLATVVSLFIDGEEIHFRKLATLQEHQGKGYASKLLAHVFEIARQNKSKKVWCNSRVSACQLYEKFGMKKTDQTYTKLGIDFVIMERILP